MKCLNCGQEFIRKSRNYKYCSAKCYWEYHCKDILKNNKQEKGQNMSNTL